MTAQRVERTKWSIVLAEDDDDYAVLVERALEKASSIPVEIRRARNGEEAVSLLSESAPDLLLLDLKMPGMSGHDALEQIKGDGRLRPIPVAVLSSSDRDEDVAEGSDAKAEKKSGGGGTAPGESRSARSKRCPSGGVTTSPTHWPRRRRGQRRGRRQSRLPLRSAPCEGCPTSSSWCACSTA